MIFQSQFHGPTHGILISGMIPAGNIGGADKGKDRHVRIHALSHVTVEIDTQHTNSFK
jgi:hypothetical protein